MEYSNMKGNVSNCSGFVISKHGKHLRPVGNYRNNGLALMVEPMPDTSFWDFSVAKHGFGGQKRRFWVAAGAIPSSRADGCIDILVPLVAADHDRPRIDTQFPHLQIIFQ